MANIIVKLTGPEPRANIAGSLQRGNSHSYLPSFLRYLGESIGAANPSANVQILNDNAVAATGTITIVDNTKVTANDTYQIGSMTLTAVASGATGAQFNIGASATATALNLNRAVGANSSGRLSASSTAGVVTVRCSIAGDLGNAIPIIVTQFDTGATASAALSGGSEDTGVPRSYNSF